MILNSLSRNTFTTFCTPKTNTRRDKKKIRTKKIIKKNLQFVDDNTDDSGVMNTFLLMNFATLVIANAMVIFVY